MRFTAGSNATIMVLLMSGWCVGCSNGKSASQGNSEKTGASKEFAGKPNSSANNPRPTLDQQPAVSTKTAKVASSASRKTVAAKAKTLKSPNLVRGKVTPPDRDTPNVSTDVEIAKPIPVSKPVTPTTDRANTGQSLEQQIANLVIPPAWLMDTKPKWDTSQPWGKGRLEIRRLLGFGKDQQRREAIQLMWAYKQKGDMGNEHEYPMYTHLGNELVWSIAAHREFLAKDHENPPVYAMKSLAAIYTAFGKFELAKEQIDTAMRNLPAPPWRVMRQAEFHEAYGDLYAAWGKLDEAKHHYAEAVRIYPTAKPKYGGHLLPRRAKKAQSKLDLLSFKALSTATLRDGQFRDKALGYTGDINLAVTVKNGRITHIDVKHTEKIDQNACVLIPERIIAKQSLLVDGISGATVTKDAIVSGAFRALKQAGLK